MDEIERAAALSDTQALTRAVKRSTTATYQETSDAIKRGNPRARVLPGQTRTGRITVIDCYGAPKVRIEPDW